MSINGSLVADMKGIKEIKRKRLDYWERIPEQNIGDTNLKKKTKKVRYQSLQDQKGYRGKKNTKFSKLFCLVSDRFDTQRNHLSAKKCLVAS